MCTVMLFKFFIIFLNNYGLTFILLATNFLAMSSNLYKCFEIKYGSSSLVENYSLVVSNV